MRQSIHARPQASTLAGRSVLDRLRRERRAETREMIFIIAGLAVIVGLMEYFLGVAMGG